MIYLQIEPIFDFTVDTGAQEVVIDHHGTVRIGTRDEISTSDQETQILNEPVDVKSAERR